MSFSAFSSRLVPGADKSQRKFKDVRELTVRYHNLDARS